MVLTYLVSEVQNGWALAENSVQISTFATRAEAMEAALLLATVAREAGRQAVVSLGSSERAQTLSIEAALHELRLAA